MALGVEIDQILHHAEDVLNENLSVVLENKIGTRNTVLTVNNGRQTSREKKRIINLKLRVGEI